jgi:HK97 family phage portal protein
MPPLFSRLGRWLGGRPTRAFAHNGAAASAAAHAERKASATGALIALTAQGRPVWTPRDYAALAKEGFARNAVVYRAVRMIAEAAGSLSWLAYEGDRELDAHPLLALVERPNARQTGADLMESLYGHLLIAGNAYVEQVPVEGAPRELHVLRPDRMKVVPGADGWPEAYEYSAGGETLRFEVGRDRVRPILHLSLFHPTDDHYGMSPLEAAAVSVDIHNSAGGWNKSLLDNSARPSGALVYTPSEPGVALAQDQYERLKAELEASFQGAGNAGRPLLLEGGLDWKAIGLSPKDMDFIEAKNGAARDIALAFGVPPMLLGIPGDNTYANYREANRAFWRQTVLPLAAKAGKALSAWLAPAFGADVRLCVDLDRVEALGEEREALWTRLRAADFLTVNEKRQAVGYGPVEGGDAAPEAVGGAGD